ncbi:MAG: tRNA threonylcarbamoyladenosine dehydratase [Oscillospiraceae bacterium]|nr:tRNA threonylcarbamoyladenosine dehydratase [Oscillospiraceae bacterium]
MARKNCNNIENIEQIPFAKRNERTVRVIGENASDKLRTSHIAVFGAGGVGGATIEALARIGVGRLDIIDGDRITKNNLNRQMLALYETIGERKANVAKTRVCSINPDCIVQARDIFVTPENINEFDFSSYSYVVDAIDNVTAKIAIIAKCRETATPVISCMGTGNKLDPTRFRIDDISKTSVCPLARVMRRELKNRDIERLNVLWSDENPIVNDVRQRIPGSVSFVPPTAGMIIAGFVVKQLIERNGSK